MRNPFEKRLRRAEFLLKEWPFSANILGLFARLTEVQRQIWEGIDDPAATGSEDRVRGEGYRQILEAVRQHAPAPLADRAKEMKPGDLLELEVRASTADPVLDPVDAFFLRILEQPLCMQMIRPEDLGRSEDPPSACPFCRLAPLVGVLREDKQAETVRRTLLCPRCCNEWDFPRILCPSCREEKPEKLPRYTAQQIPWMRVEACDTCMKYLKSVDLTVNWDADPIVDELASTPLDVIAREHGYTKIAPNLAGI